MIKELTQTIEALHVMKHYPDKLYYIGRLELLKKMKVAIVGSRKPNQYAREMTAKIAAELAKNDVVTVSGGAMGIDAVAHKFATPSKSIMVAGTGLDKRYPSVNKSLIEQIEQQGLVLSQFEEGSPSKPYHFPLRNELLIALSDLVVVTYADLKSGTMHSVNYALKMEKKIFVLPHRIGESEGTNQLLAQNRATAIYDIQSWSADIIPKEKRSKRLVKSDAFLEYCAQNPTYEMAMRFDSGKVFEYELLGKIRVSNGKVYLT